MDRRKFLHRSFSSALAWHMAGCVRLPINSENNGSAVLFIHGYDNTSRMRILNLSSFDFSDIKIPLKAPHTSQPVFGKPYEHIVFDFMGKALKVNTLTKEFFFAPEENARFLGHGTQTGDGVIWCTELLESGKAVVRARSVTDMALIPGIAVSFPGGHHVAKMTSSQVLVSSTYNHDEKVSSLMFFDPGSNKLKKTNLPANLIISHILSVSNTEVVCITNYARNTGGDFANKKSFYANATEKMIASIPHTDTQSYAPDFDAPAPLIYGNMDGEMKVFWDEHNRDLFRFSFGIYPFSGTRDQFITGHTNSNKVIIWKNRNLEKIIDVTSPAGIIQTPDRKKLVILSDGILKVYSLQTHRFERDIKYEGFITTMSAYA